MVDPKYQWKPGTSGNPAGRPKRNRLLGVWSSRQARAAFDACATPEQRQRVSARVLALATGEDPPRWAQQAVCEALGLDPEYLRRTGHFPRSRTYVWG
jgi:hypothetical protein